jgi:WD40 repeat protein
MFQSGRQIPRNRRGRPSNQSKHDTSYLCFPLTFLQIWDIAKKRIKHLLTGHNQEIYSLDFSRDGQFLVSGSGDKSARIWDINSGHCVFDLKIEDVVLGEAGPIDAGITSVAREYQNHRNNLN